MSDAEGDDEVNRREVAYRLFAAEFDDADFSYAESDEERAPNYVVTPTGARVNRVFVVGVLTEVEDVNEDVVRARVVDPTGAFVVYAGQYQPEALAALESADTPSFVAVTGKARTFQPDDADVVYTSIRPETVTEVDAATRDRWVVTTAEQTAERVATMAAAHERVERDDRLRDALTEAGVEPGLAAGIPLALDHYETSPAYLAAVRDLAVGAAEVVAGEAESAGSLDLAPSDGSDVPLDFAADLDADVHAEPAAAETADDSASAADSGATAEDTEPADEPASEPAADADPSPEPAAETPDPSEVAAEAEPDDEQPAESEQPEASGEGDESESAESEDSEPVEATTGDDDLAAADADAAADDGEMYELSEEEREEVKEEYGVDFSTGSEVPEPGEADIDAPGPDEGIEPAAGAADETAEAAGGDDTEDDLGDFDAGDDEPFDPDDRQQDADEDDADDPDDFTEREYDEPESDASDSEAASMDLDLEDYVVELMDELDDGDGAPREDVIATATDERDADEGDVEDAIQDALMSGQCYESGDDHLKAI